MISFYMPTEMCLVFDGLQGETFEFCFYGEQIFYGVILESHSQLLVKFLIYAVKVLVRNTYYM
jgi:hypothetical protein